MFFMASGCATRVQRICKKLQTVRGAGGQLLGFFFRAVRRYFQEGSEQRKEGRATGGESPLTTVRDSGEYFLGAWAGSFLEGVFHLSKTEFLRGRQAFGCRGAEEKKQSMFLERDNCGGG